MGSQVNGFYRVVCLGRFGAVVARQLLESGVDAANVWLVGRFGAGEEVPGAVRVIDPGSDQEVGALRQAFSGEGVGLAEPGWMEFVIGALWEGVATRALPEILVRCGSGGGLSIGVVCLPGLLHGDRRRSQALGLVGRVRAEGKLVVCVDSEVVCGMIDRSSPVSALDAVCARQIAEAVRCTLGLVGTGDDGGEELRSFWGGDGAGAAEVCFVSVGAGGADRSAQAASQLLGHPLLRSGKVLESADAVFVLARSGQELTVGEAQHIVKQLNQRCRPGAVSLHMVADRGGDSGDFLTISVFIRRSLDVGLDAVDRRGGGATGPVPEQAVAGAAVVPGMNTMAVQTMFERRAGAERPARFTQVQLPLNLVTRGRFAQTQSTVYKGEDLDVPAYLRRGIVLE